MSRRPCAEALHHYGRSLNVKALTAELVRIDDERAEMLAALREVEPFLDNQADCDDGRPNDAMRHLVEVRAAIRKAEGRT